MTIYGPKVDGGFTIKLDLGEYEKANISELVKLQTDNVVKVTLEQNENER